MTQLSSTKIRTIGLLSIVIIAILAWFGFRIESLRSAEFKRVQHAFQQMSLAIAKSQEVVSLELTPVHAGTASYPDGTKASLWVTNPAPLGVRRGCFYIDEQRKSGVFEYGASGYSEFACVIPGKGWVCTSGMGGGCVQPGKQVTLERQGSIVIGYVGLWPARTVSVTANGTTTTVPVTFGYFILPGSLSADPASKFAITLMSKAGISLGTVTDLKASGSATPSPLAVGTANTSTGSVTPKALIQTVLTVHVTPSINLHGGEQVLVQLRGAASGERFRVSECASAADANIAGCGDQLASQPFIDTDPSGAGSMTVHVQARAATKPYNTTTFQLCTDQCVIMATGTFGETSRFVYAPLKFSIR